jgi:nitrite reductase/ring-hydroxylating ferredoxin subunit
MAERACEQVEARCPGLSVRDIVARDGQETPSFLGEQEKFPLNAGDVPISRYIGRQYFETEMRKLWPNVWQWACREENVSTPGDYVVYDIGPYSLIVVRDESGDIRAYYNSCLHRGTKLKPSPSEGWSPSFTCQFHGWRWSLAGELVEVPCSWDFPHVVSNLEGYRLPQVRVGTWGGFVFICLDETAPSLEDFLGVLPSHLQRWDLSQRYIAVHVEKELPCNWKAASEAFMESYHTMATHPQLMYGASDVNMQYDIFDDNISRYYGAVGVPSPNLPGSLSEQEIFERMFMGDRTSGAEPIVLKSADTARAKVAHMLRSAVSSDSRADLSELTDTEIIDVIGYGVFPNAVFFPTFASPLVYRFRPLAQDHRRSLFDLLILRPIPSEGGRPEPAEVCRLKEDDSFTQVPGLDPAVAAVLDQDTANMRLQQEGLESSYRSNLTLSCYQESRIRHFHHTLEKYCG